jgi:dipeptidyl aminopeptidase/acylaminoacyl peptidase
VAYPSSGHLVYLKGDALVAQPFDAKRLELSGEPAPLGVQPAIYMYTVSGIVDPVSWAGYSVSRNGVLAWFEGGSWQKGTSLTWFDRTGKELGTVGEPGAYSNPALSPDGRRLAVDVRNPQGFRDIWVIDLLQGGRTRLTFDRAEDMGATWDPRGDTIAFTSERRGRREIYLKRASGSGEDELLLDSEGGWASPEDWSSDGKWLALNWRHSGALRGPHDLLLLPMPGERGRKPVSFVASESYEDMGRFSPNGRFLAYRSDESGRSEVYVREVSANGTPGPGKWQISSDGGVEPQWRRDGKELFYVSGVAAVSGASPGTINAVTVSADGASFVAGRPRPLFEVLLPEQRRNRYVVTGDGQRFLVTRDRPVAQSIQVLLNALPPKR